MEFGIWLPVYGGWLRAQGFNTEPCATESIALAEQVEHDGYDYVYASENFLNCIHGAAHDVDDAWITLSAVAAKTNRINLVGALKPGFRPPIVAAQMVATLDRISRGRIAVNIVCGWWQEEFQRAGVVWREHDDKYAFASRYLQELGEFWVKQGDYTPRKRLAGGQMPKVWVSGHSQQALAFAAEKADVLFLNGMPPVEARSIADRLSMIDGQRKPRIAINAFVILDKSDSAAFERRDELLGRARRDLIAFYRNEIVNSGSSAWSSLSEDQFIDANGGFPTALVGGADAITTRLHEYNRAGVDLILCQFPDMSEDSRRFANEVMRRFPANTAQVNTKRGVYA